MGSSSAKIMEPVTVRDRLVDVLRDDLIGPADPREILGDAPSSPACPRSGDRALPIVAVDGPLYQRLPCFIVATVDKLAQLPWVGETGALFGRVSRHDKAGFYGQCANRRRCSASIWRSCPQPSVSTTTRAGLERVI